jgi:hypothetical protein
VIKIHFQAVWFTVLFVLGSLIPIPGRADQLTYYVYPPPLGIDWASPATLIWSAVLNDVLTNGQRFRNLHMIGHVNFDLQCDPSSELPEGDRIVTGQTNSDDNQMNSDILTKGYGLGALLAQYSGRWETESEIEADLPERFLTGMIAYIQFEVSPTTCARAVEYLQEYQARGYDQIYGGLEDRPRYGEGAGCSAFGESLLEIAGVMPPEWRTAWSNAVEVPDELIGGPATGKHVSVVEALFGPHAWHWGKSQDSYALTFWDPDRMFHWIRRAWRSPLPLTGLTYEPVRNHLAHGIRIDAREVPTPQDGFWK